MSKLTNLASAVKERQNRLSKEPTTHKKWYDLKNNAQADTAEIHIYDMIGEWGVTANDFITELKAINAKHIDLHLSSEGGEVFDGVAIYEALKQHPAEITTYVDSLAASAASFIAMAGDEVLMGRNARMMIHDAAIGGGYVTGNANDIKQHIKDLEEMVTFLDDMSDNIADIYVQKAGGTVAEWRALMEKETWFNANQAIEAGLADGIIGETDRASNKAAKEPQAVLTKPPVESVEPTFEWNPATFLRAFEEART